MATYPIFANNGASMLPPLTSMQFNQYIQSPSGRYRLVYQADGNFVLYDYPAGLAVWVADATSAYSTSSRLGNGGKDEVYIDRVLVANSRARGTHWNCKITTVGTLYEGQDKRVHLSVQDDGNLVLMDIQALWAFNTHLALTPSVGAANVIGPGTSLEVQKPYRAGNFYVVFQQDGNLVVYRNDGVPVWNSQTNGSGADHAVMQEDGNFVIYKPDGTPVWNTGTGGNPGAFLQIQSNGNLVVCKGFILWARFGFTPEFSTKPPRVIVYPDHTDPIENGTDPFPTYFHIGYEFP